MAQKNWSSKWFQGDRRTKKQIEDLLNNNNLILSRLTDILDQELKKLEISETNESEMENPNWPFKQARRVGQKKALIDIRNLINRSN